MRVPSRSPQGKAARHERDATLGRIAEVLGCPIEVLTGNVGTELSDAAELMRLWLAIETPGDRLNVLDLARALAGTQP